MKLKYVKFYKDRRIDWKNGWTDKTQSGNYKGPLFYLRTVKRSMNGDIIYFYGIYIGSYDGKFCF